MKTKISTLLTVLLVISTAGICGNLNCLQSAKAKETDDKTSSQNFKQKSPDLKKINKGLIFTVKGMTCSSCINHVQKAVKGVKGVKSVEVSLEKETAKVITEKGIKIDSKIIDAITKAGYTAKLTKESPKK